MHAVFRGRVVAHSVHEHLTAGTTVRWARRPTSAMTTSARGTAKGLFHRASNSSWIHIMASGASSSQTDS